MVEFFPNKKRDQGTRRRAALSLNLESLEGRVVLASPIVQSALSSLVLDRLTLENDISQDRAAIRNDVAQVIYDGTQQKDAYAEDIENAEHQVTVDKANRDAAGIVAGNHDIGADKYDYEQVSKDESLAQNHANQTLNQLNNDGTQENKDTSSEIVDLNKNPDYDTNGNTVYDAGYKQSLTILNDATAQSNSGDDYLTSIRGVIDAGTSPNPAPTPSLPTPGTPLSSYTSSPSLFYVDISVSGSSLSGSAVDESFSNRYYFSPDGTYQTDPAVGGIPGPIATYTFTVGQDGTLTVDLDNSSGDFTGTTFIFT